MFGNYVGGRWIAIDDANPMARRNPADQRDLIGYVPKGSADDVQRAVEAASSALDRWRATPAPTRGKILLRAAGLFEQRREQLAALVTREQGKTLAESRGEVDMTVRMLEYMSGEGRRMKGETLHSERPGRFVYTIRQPIGVVGLITPWNYPLVVPAWKIAAAIVSGNTVVWKPSRLTPLSSEALMQVFDEAGVPAGVINVVNGGGAIAGAALAAHPSVRAISFTASDKVARARTLPWSLSRSVLVESEPSQSLSPTRSRTPTTAEFALGDSVIRDWAQVVLTVSLSNHQSLNQVCNRQSPDWECNRLIFQSPSYSMLLSACTYSNPKRPFTHRFPWVTSLSKGDDTFTMRLSCTCTVSVQPTPQ